jgi:hypothetical protein
MTAGDTFERASFKFLLFLRRSLIKVFEELSFRLGPV